MTPEQNAQIKALADAYAQATAAIAYADGDGAEPHLRDSLLQKGRAARAGLHTFIDGLAEPADEPAERQYRVHYGSGGATPWTTCPNEGMWEAVKGGYISAVGTRYEGRELFERPAGRAVRFGMAMASLTAQQITERLVHSSFHEFTPAMIEDVMDTIIKLAGEKVK